MSTFGPKSRILRRGRLGSRGFTLVELLLVVVIIGLLSGIAQPSLHRALVKARAADVIGDLNVIKAAILTYRADLNAWPPDRNRGIIPPGLADYLPAGFSFKNPDYTLDYDDWSTKKNTPFAIGLTYISNDRELGVAVLDMLGKNIWSDRSTKYTWIIEG